jgi:hypothetical protein
MPGVRVARFEGRALLYNRGDRPRRGELSLFGGRVPVALAPRESIELRAPDQRSSAGR